MLPRETEVGFDLLFLNTAGSGRLRKGSIYPLSITLRINLEVPMRFQNSRFLRRLPLTFSSVGWSVNSNSNNSLSQCTCAISETSSSNTSLFRAGVGLHSVTGLAGDVRVSWGKAGSPEDIPGA